MVWHPSARPTAGGKFPTKAADASRLHMGMPGAKATTLDPLLAAVSPIPLVRRCLAKKNRQQQVRLQAAIAAAAQPALPGSCLDDQQVRLPQQLPHVRKLR